MKHMNVSARQFHPALGDSGAELEVYCRERTGLLADDGARACSAPVLPPMPEEGQAFPSLRSWRHEAERHYVAQVRALCGDDARAAARMAGVSRGHWYELLKKYGF